MAEGSVAGMTVAALRKDEVGEHEKARGAKAEAIQKESEAKYWGKTQMHYLKMEEARQKQGQKAHEKLEAESEAVHQKRLTLMINRYMEAFPFLRDKIPKISAKVSIPELEEVLKLIREEMDTQRSLIQLHKFTDYGFYMIENYWGDGSKLTFLPPALRVNLTHLNEYHKRGLFRNELEPILMEIDIEYPWLGRQSLVLRSMEALSEVLLRTHMINTNPDARKILGLEQEPPKDVPDMAKL